MSTAAPSRPPESNVLDILMRNLSGKCRVASELMKSVRGPRSDTHKMRAVIALKAEFERAGHKVGHNPKDSAGYTGSGTSPFDRFVRQFFKDVDPADTQRRGVNDAIAFASREGRQAAARAKQPLPDEGNRSRIQQMLIEAGVTNFSPDS